MAAGQVGAMYAAQAKTKSLDPDEIHKKFDKIPYFAEIENMKAQAAKLKESNPTEAARITSQIETRQKEQMQAVDNFMRSGNSAAALEALKLRTGAQTMPGFYTGTGKL